MIYGLILAAGRGERFGATKQLALLDGVPLLQHAINALAAARVETAVVVLGHDSDRITAGIHMPDGWQIVVNAEHEQGQSTSLVAGIEAAPEGSTGVVIVLGDQPRTRPDAIRALIDAQTSGAGPVVRASYEGRPGHPVLFDCALWPDLRTARGDGGARALLARRSEDITYVEVGGDPPKGVDTPGDLAGLSWRPSE